MPKETTILPAIFDTEANKKGSPITSELWLRISAFLSLKSPNTQRTYLGIVNEWCEFLGAIPGTDEAATKILAATDLHAISYKSWLEERPGEAPRLKASQKTNIKTEPKTAGYKGPRNGSKALSHTSGPSASPKFKTKRDGLESTLSNATIYKKLVALRRIYRMLIGAGIGINQNPFDSDRVPPPAKESGRKRPTEMIDFELVKHIINAPDISTSKGLRDRALLAILFGGGLRRSEVIKIRIGDLKTSSGGTQFVFLRSTKAKKDADQALPRWAATALQELKESRIKEGANDGDYLFVSYRGRGGTTPTPNPLSDNGLYRLFKQYCLLGGAGLNVTPHSARATAITKLLTDGIPHRLVQEFSRHSSIQMVELYDKRRIGVDENPAKGLEFD